MKLESILCMPLSLRDVSARGLLARSLLLCAAVLLCASPVRANETAPADQAVELERLTRGILTEDLQSRTSVRPLTVREQKRAGQLRGSFGGMISEGISDLELLGIHAHSEEEREIYAEQLALRYRALVRAALLFDAAVVQAHRRLFGDQPLFDARQWQPPGYRWNLKVGGTADRQMALAKVLDSARAGRKSHIRLAADGRQEVIDWIRRSLPSSLVKQGLFEVDWTDDAAGFAEGLEIIPEAGSGR